MVADTMVVEAGEPGDQGRVVVATGDGCHLGREEGGSNQVTVQI